MDFLKVCSLLAEEAADISVLNVQQKVMKNPSRFMVKNTAEDIIMKSKFGLRSVLTLSNANPA